MKSLLSVFLLSSLALMSCSKDLDNMPEATSNSGNLRLFGEVVEQKDGVLKFSDEVSFKKVLKNLGEAQAVMTKAGNDGVGVDADYALEDNGFQSIYDDYVASADEAELYYDRWEDYYQFKDKYSNLYFPELENDYSAYLPISDKNIAKLANKEGFIMIGDELVDCKDITTYEDLERLGLAIPNFKMRDPGDIIHYREGDNMVWVKIHDQGFNGKRLFQFEVCFRDKGFLGVWYNRRASTHLWASATVYGVTDSDDWTKESMSSHDYSFAFNVSNGDGTLTLRLKYGPLGSKELTGIRGFNKY